MMLPVAPSRDVPVIDFHTHFPYWGNMRFSPYLDRYRERFGEEKVKIHLARQRKAAEARWKAWNFEPPESEDRPVEELAADWKKEVEKHNLRKVVFLTGGGNDSLARIIQHDPRSEEHT